MVWQDNIGQWMNPLWLEAKSIASKVKRELFKKKKNRWQPLKICLEKRKKKAERIPRQSRVELRPIDKCHGDIDDR